MPPARGELLLRGVGEHLHAVGERRLGVFQRRQRVHRGDNAGCIPAGQGQRLLPPSRDGAGAAVDLPDEDLAAAEGDAGKGQRLLVGGDGEDAHLRGDLLDAVGEEEFIRQSCLRRQLVDLPQIGVYQVQTEDAGKAGLIAVHVVKRVVKAAFAAHFHLQRLRLATQQGAADGSDAVDAGSVGAGGALCGGCQHVVEDGGVELAHGACSLWFVAPIVPEVDDEDNHKQ